MSRLKQEIQKFQEEILPQLPSSFLEEAQVDTKRLLDLKISEDALTVGDKAPDFKMPNAVGKEVSLYDALNTNDYVVLSFYRGAWCPYCNLEINALGKINNQVKELNGAIFAISPETPDLSLSMKEKHELEFEVLSDTDYKVEKEYGLVFSLSKKLRPYYESFGFDIPASTKNDSYDLPMPATYVVDKNKNIIYAYVNEDYTQRSEPQDVLEAIVNDKK